jgi:signal transduction histidine kinase
LRPERLLTAPAVLVVDDYGPNRTALRALLAPIAPVTEADSGAYALDEIARRDFAVVVLDVQMPRMDGITVARRIRAGGRNAQVPIILLTAMDSGAAPTVDGYAAGAVDYLRRPVDPLILKSKVAIFVELSRSREQSKREAAERARLEAERAAAQRASEQKDRLLEVLSHDLRTPLTSILLWSEMLLNRTLTPEAVRRGLQTMDVCARREAHIVENVLEMSRVVTGTLTLEVGTVDVDELVATAMADTAQLAAERAIDVGRAPEPPGPGRTGVGDRRRLRRAFHNLLESAIKCTPARGRVDVAVEDIPAAFRIQVDDSGSGFPPQLGPMLLAPFERCDATSGWLEGRLDLGLALAKAIVEIHGGAITAANDGPNGGLRFTVTLPRAPSWNQEASPAPASL